MQSTATIPATPHPIGIAKKGKNINDTPESGNPHAVNVNAA
jgi:hypothetical protein